MVCHCVSSGVRLGGANSLIASGLVLVAALNLLGCAGTGPVLGKPAYSPAQLLANPGLTEAEWRQPEESAHVILAVNPAMRAFLAHYVDADAADGVRLQQLLAGMIDQGLLALEFVPGQTRTAQQTFETRSGNCLSFTNLFVALAREIGLDVRYQLVTTPAQWERQGNWVVIDDHINTILHNIRVKGTYRRDYVVDFNIADFQGNYPREEVSDARAFALYFNNRGAELLQQGEWLDALGYFIQAYERAPDQPSLWLNLGAWFNARGDLARAQSAYLQALRLKPHYPAALSSLALLYQAMGEPQWADAVERRLMSLRDQDPYYFYQRSLAAYRRDELGRAEALLHQAIRLKRDEHRFFFLRALLAYQQAKHAAAEKDLRRARSLADRQALRAIYTGKIEWLRQVQGS